MKKIALFIMLMYTLICNSYAVKAEGNASDYDINMKRDILILMMAYPEYAVNLEKDNNGYVYLIMKSGKKILYDDKKIKNFEQKLNNPDLEDMLEQIYPLCPIDDVMEKNFDPGRIRVYSLLNEVYGSSKKAIESNLVNVEKINCRFNKNNKAAESLKNVMDELLPLAKGNSKISSCIYPLSGTYNYRVISGTGRLSPHAFGNAIDLARDNRDYWKWASIEQGRNRIKSYPKEIVEIFEKNNFVWGGKWNHFDILHFEYRPEIILKAKYFKDFYKKGEKWYEGIPINDENTKDNIKKIEAVLGN
ncbi:D-alanyl-D-alanine carboxypeptidase [Clostridium sp. USBA 49]|uniref:M15 family metallopeptidase n=1 Tax=Clostridium sp. USBA 49 TaxID=1881060 RepID=UPI00099910D2|nr:M15 family metallopeptidase [Clostridium sp. USBA 49]SKA78902.1 D-alanyl-D-alanine carboxypeptidase [Clostridium sp. USBA 49]